MKPRETAALLALALQEMVESVEKAPRRSLPTLALLGSEVVQWQSANPPTAETPHVLKARQGARKTLSEDRVSALSTLLWCEERLASDPPIEFALWAPTGARRALYAFPLVLACLGAMYAEEPDELTATLFPRLLSRSLLATRRAQHELAPLLSPVAG